MEWQNAGAVLFDLDGVLTPTAEVHMRAWQQLFIGVLERLPEHAEADRSPYTDKDYFGTSTDGRYEGVEAFLRSRASTCRTGRPRTRPTR